MELSRYEAPRAPIASARYILMADTPNPYLRKKRIRKLKLALIALACGLLVTSLAYAAVRYTNILPQGNSFVVDQ